MIRTQIQLTEAQARRIRTLAAARGVSMAEIIRSSVDAFLDSETPDRADIYARASALIGRYEDREGATDLSERHDAYLVDGIR